MTPSPPVAPDTAAAAREAAEGFAELLGMAARLHLPGVRDSYRNKLESVIALAERAAEAASDAGIVQEARAILIRAHAARAEDARYGAGQLSRGSQRAPTPEDCDDGWMRVADIVRNAEDSARQAAHLASLLNTPALSRCAQKAEAAAVSAGKIVAERNHAYTFHTDPGFSFGEGWYLAAAALLAGVSIQIKPDTAQARQAERFLSDAGLSRFLVPYRPRPRSNKQLTAIVADAFRADPAAAQRAVRAAFLGEGATSPSLVEWTRRKVGSIPAKKVLLWVRNCVHDAYRNSTREELYQLSEVAQRVGLTPVFFGDAVPDGGLPAGAVDMTLAWKEPLFQGPDMRRAQLRLFEELKVRHGLVGQLGVTTAGMDGPALTGVPTLYITPSSNVRMHRWVGVVPGYREVVRRAGYLDVVEDALRLWRG